MNRFHSWAAELRIRRSGNLTEIASLTGGRFGCRGGYGDPPSRNGTGAHSARAWRGLGAVLFAVWVTCIGVAATASAASEGPADRTASPYFWVKPVSSGPDMPGPNQADPLPLKSTKVEATVVGVFAEVKVEQHYTNAGSVPLEAVYVFPGSTRAAVHGLTLVVGDRRLEAKTKEKGEARKTYETAKTEGKTATLLEQHRPNVFQMNVANILPGDDITVELRYTELLSPTEGVYEFVYPGVVGPRYSNKPESGAGPEHSWIANPYLTKGTGDPASFALNVHLVSGVALQDVQCRTHSTRIGYLSAKEARIEMNDTQGSNRDFILNYRLTGPAVQSGVVLAEGNDENFFLLTVQPPDRASPQSIPAREYVFIVDVSGSMNGFPLATAKTLIGELLATLREQDSFNILLFAGGSEVFAPASVRATPENVAAALRLIAMQNGSGATELLPAMKRALSLPQAEAVSRTFVVVTDGYVGIEPEAFELVRSNLGRANLFAFGIGSSVNRHLIEGLARAGQGEPFVVTDPELARDAAGKFKAYVSTPLLTRVNVSFENFDAYEVQPSAVPDLMAQRPLVVFGKWRGPAQGRIAVTGISGAAPYRSDHDIAGATRLETASGLARLWARSRIAELGDLNELQATDDRKAQITSLGLTYNLLTPFTSFIAVDETVRRTTPTLQTIKQPLPLPANVENSAVGGMVPAAPEPGTYGLMAVALIAIAIALRGRALKGR